MHQDARLDAVFSALADPTRRRMIARLRGGSATVSELAEPFHMSLPAVSKHVGVLVRAGLVRRRKTGRVWSCRLVAAPLARADAWLAHYRMFWHNRFDALDSYLATGKAD